MTNDSIPTTTSSPCPCGDYYCADYAPTDGIDRSDCCQYCGFYDCDVCGWTATADTGEQP